VPQLLARAGVEGIEIVEGGRHIHDAVHDDRRGLHGFHDIRLEDPGRPQLLHVGNVDLARRKVARLIVVAVGVQEVVPVAAARSSMSCVTVCILP